MKVNTPRGTGVDLYVGIFAYLSPRFFMKLFDKDHLQRADCEEEHKQ